MPRPDVTIDGRTIRRELADGRHLLRGLTLLDATDSTNRALLRLPVTERHAHAVVAACQTAGRGRRDRGWHSPPGGNLYFSLGWNFDPVPPALGLLPLATAVVAARELEGLGTVAVGIKWPNDLECRGRKLGGILVESQSAGGSQVAVAIGIGINVRMPDDAAEGHIDRPWTDLHSTLGVGIDRPERLRDRLAGRLIRALLGGLSGFATTGFEPYRGDWDRRDVLRGRRVRVSDGDREVAGVAVGIGPNGALRVETVPLAGVVEVQEFYAGDVSVRPR